MDSTRRTCRDVMSQVEFGFKALSPKAARAKNEVAGVDSNKLGPGNCGCNQKWLQPLLWKVCRDGAEVTRSGRQSPTFTRLLEFCHNHHFHQ